MIQSLEIGNYPIEIPDTQSRSELRPASCCKHPKAEPALHAADHKKAAHAHDCATTRTSLVAPTPRTDNSYFGETACAYASVCDSSSTITSRRSCGVQLSNSPSTDQNRPLITPPEARSRVRGQGYLHILPKPDDAMLGRRMVTPRDVEDLRVRYVKGVCRGKRRAHVRLDREFK